MRKRMFTILVALVLLINIPASMVQASMTTMNAFERELLSAVGAETLAIMEGQKDAVDAYAAFCDYFRTTDGTVVFPNDYGGEAVIDNMLYIYLTDISKETVARYTPAFAGYEKTVAFGKVKYSYNYLTELRDATVKKLGQGVVSGYIDCSANEVVIEVDSERLQVDRVAVEGSEGKAVPVIIKAGTKLAPAVTPIYGGDRITKTAVDWWKSVAVCGFYDENPAILTCGHQTHYSNDPIGYTYGINNSANMAMEVAISQYSNGGVGDYSICTLTGNSFVETDQIKYIDGELLPVDSALRSVPSGTLVMKYGATSGFATGYVLTKNCTANYNVRNEQNEEIVMQIRGLDRVGLTQGASVGGDSGGPYFIYAEGECSFLGIHSGGDSLTQCYFTPYALVEDLFTVNISR